MTRRICILLVVLLCAALMFGCSSAEDVRAGFDALRVNRPAMFDTELAQRYADLFDRISDGSSAQAQEYAELVKDVTAAR